MREALFDLVMLAADCWRMSIFVEKSSTIVSLHATNYGESCAIPASHRVFSWAGYDAMLVWMAFHARVDLPLRAFGIAMAERVYYDPTRQRADNQLASLESKSEQIISDLIFFKYKCGRLKMGAFYLMTQVNTNIS